jgi:hypothetical protein
MCAVKRQPRSLIVGFGRDGHMAIEETFPMRDGGEGTEDQVPTRWSQPRCQTMLALYNPCMLDEARLAEIRRWARW